MRRGSKHAEVEEGYRAGRSRCFDDAPKIRPKTSIASVALKFVCARSNAGTDGADARRDPVPETLEGIGKGLRVVDRHWMVEERGGAASGTPPTPG